jgi:hypothetical protein
LKKKMEMLTSERLDFGEKCGDFPFISRQLEKMCEKMNEINGKSGPFAGESRQRRGNSRNFFVSLSLEIKNWNRNKFSPTSKRRVSSAVQIFWVKRRKNTSIIS